MSAPKMPRSQELGVKEWLNLLWPQLAPNSPAPTTLSFRAAFIRKATHLFVHRLKTTQLLAYKRRASQIWWWLIAFSSTHCSLLSYTLPLFNWPRFGLWCGNEKKQTAETHMCALNIPAQVRPISIILTMCSNTCYNFDTMLKHLFIHKDFTKMLEAKKTHTYAYTRTQSLTCCFKEMVCHKQRGCNAGMCFSLGNSALVRRGRRDGDLMSLTVKAMEEQPA